MNRSLSVSLVASVVALTGCLATTPPVTNLAGQPIKDTRGPILGKSKMDDARYVLLEKNIGNGKYGVVSISKTRQAITNERQERVVFDKTMTEFAADFTTYNFQTYTDSGNYNQETVIMVCGAYPKKVEEYSPCSSAFGRTFVPGSVTKAYVAGAMSKSTKDSWENPAQNKRRYVESPRWAVKEAGVFDRLGELADAK